LLIREDPLHPLHPLHSMDPAAQAEFFPRLVAWQRSHGRSGLPWQHTQDPYRVWLSEIMLQQTQVASVLQYYPRFLQRFPTVQALAAATPDEVLALWSGLGYYSRARNLHRCAQAVVAEHGGAFPASAEQLQALPGIGRSTAAAIAAFCFGERVSILDGNVKRVLTRLLAFEGDMASATQEKLLWQRAQQLVPPDAGAAEMAAYTQGLMDLGASLCARTQPQCLLCPVQPLCAAQAQGRPEAFPVKTRRLVRRAESWWLLVLVRPDGRLWLARRPERGIWAGLHTFPVFSSRDELLAHAAQWGLPPEPRQEHEPVRHALTHRELTLHWLEWCVPEAHAPRADAARKPDQEKEQVLEQQPGRWMTLPEALASGLPAPIRAWLVEP
jgi:A/G-specific adenine glycosylase